MLGQTYVFYPILYKKKVHFFIVPPFYNKQIKIPSYLTTVQGYLCPMFTIVDFEHLPPQQTKS